MLTPSSDYGTTASVLEARSAQQRQRQAFASRSASDVLVIGGGIAGAVTAIRLREQGHDVLLIDRGYFGASGCTALASGQVHYFDPKHDVKDWLFHSGSTMVNEALLARATEQTYDLVHRLESWGVRWVKDADGNVARVQGPGMPFPSNAVMHGGGLPFMMAIAAHARKIGVRVHSRTLATDLLTSDGLHPTRERVTGAVALNTTTGCMSQYTARAVVLATGPIKFPYPTPAGPFEGMPIELSGDGVAMGLRVGSKLGKMEIGGDGLCQAFFYAAPGFEHLMAVGGRLKNIRLDPLVEETRSALAPRRSTWGAAAAAEILAGRGPILLDNRGLTTEQICLLELAIPVVMNTLRAANMVPGRDLIPFLKGNVGSCNISGGGVQINEHGASSLPGLFAAGGTSDGAYVTMAQSIATCGVMGEWVAEALPNYLADAPAPEVDEGQAQRFSSEALAPLQRSAGLSYATVHDAIERVLLDTGCLLSQKNPVLTKDVLTDGLERLRQISVEMVPRLTAADYHELAKVPGLRNFAQCLEAGYTVLRHREESRGNIFRQDFPYTDNEKWLVYTTVRSTGTDYVLNDVVRPDDGRFRSVARERVPHPFFDERHRADVVDDERRRRQRWTVMQGDM